MLKQESDFTFSLQFYKDEKKTEAKGAIFMDLAVEAKPVSTNIACYYILVLNNAINTTHNGKDLAEFPNY